MSAGCQRCYAERMAARFGRDEGDVFFPYVHRGKWTGHVELIPEKLDEPLHWRKPRRVFVNSMSDLFHEALADDEIDRVFAIMAMAERHTFQVLTKRAARMVGYFAETDRIREIELRMYELGGDEDATTIVRWPLPNVWLGVSCEDQKTADERIPLLLQTPAAVRFASLEPLLGPVDLGCYLAGSPRLDWVICGGES